MEKLAKEETAEKSPLRQRRLWALVPARGWVQRRPGKRSPASPAAGRAHSSLRAPPGRPRSQRLFSSRYLLGGGGGGDWGAEHTQWSTRKLFSGPVWAPHTPLLPGLSLYLFLQSTAAGRVCAATRRLCCARQLLNALPRAVTAFSSRSRLRRCPRTHSCTPQPAPPLRPGPERPAGQRGRITGARTRWSPGPRRKGRPGGPQRPQKPPLAVGRFWVPSTRGHQKPSESLSAHANEKLRRHFKYQISEQAPPVPPQSSPNPNYPRTSGCAHQHACFSGSYPPSSLPSFALPTSPDLVSR